GIILLSEHNVRLLRSTPYDQASKFDGLPIGRYRWRVELPIQYLADGTYTVSFDADRYGSAWYYNPYNSDAKVAFRVEGDTPDSNISHWHPDREGSFKIPMRWSGLPHAALVDSADEPVNRAHRDS